MQEICSFVLLSSESIQNQLSSLSHGEGWGGETSKLVSNKQSVINDK